MLQSPPYDALRPFSDATGFSPAGRVGSLWVNNIKLDGAMTSDRPYTRAEIDASGSDMPTHGAVCKHCGATNPTFEDLSPEAAREVVALIERGPIRAMKRLRDQTHEAGSPVPRGGCSLGAARLRFAPS